MKKFYKKAQVVQNKDKTFSITLDKRQLKTPKGQVLHIPSEQIANAMCQEWNEQKDIVDPRSMFYTQMSMTIVDMDNVETLSKEIMGYIHTDQIFYYVDLPIELHDKQNDLWNPIIKHYEKAASTNIHVTTGIAPIQQGQSYVYYIENRLQNLLPCQIVVLQQLAGLTKSILLSLAFMDDVIDGDTLWQCSYVEELFQRERWGETEEGNEVLAKNQNDLNHLVSFLTLMKG